MAHQDRDDVMKDAFEDPIKGKNDMGEFEARSADDMIKLDKHLSSSDVGKKGGSKRKFGGVMVRRASLPPTV